MKMPEWVTAWRRGACGIDAMYGIKQRKKKMTMKRNNIVLVCAMAFCCECMGADVTYTDSTIPGDTSAVSVRDGTTSMIGLDAFRHLKYYWDFDSDSNFTQATIGGVTLTKMLSAGTITGTNDVKRGAGAAYFNGDGLRMNPVPPFMTPTATEPFTVSFWFKGGHGGSRGSRIFYFGPYGSPSGNAAVDTFLELMYSNDSSLRQFYWFGGAWRSHRFTISEEQSPMDRWVHVAFSCMPNGTWQADGSVSNVAVTLYFDGDVKGTVNGVLNTGESPYLCFGTGFGPTSASSNPVGDTIIDEIMIFDKALSSDEVAWVAENTRPFEFSAGWDVAFSGMLDIAGLQPQTVRGMGTVAAEGTLTLSPTSDSFFAGTIAGNSLAVDSSAIQTLASAASYTGMTTIVSGTLKIDPARAIPSLQNTLVAYYSCDAPDDPGRDDSGNGNNLTRTAGALDIDATNSVAGGALYFPGTDVEAGYGSDGVLNGFSAGEDNSFIVAAWVRIDSFSTREGFFMFKTTTTAGLRLNTSKKALYYGDTGQLNSITTSSDLDDGLWRHCALVYDAAPMESEPNYRLFVDGQQIGSGTKTETYNHASAAFVIGAGPQYNTAFNGAIDEVFVLNGANTNDVAKLYNYRRAEFDAANAASVLPENTTLTVEAGATLFITNSIESVRELCGGGTVYIAPGSRLNVRRISRFTGRIVGGGSLSHPGMTVVLR